MHVILESTSYISHPDRVRLLLRWSFWMAIVNLFIVCPLSLTYVYPFKLESIQYWNYVIATILSHISFVFLVILFTGAFIFSNLIASDQKYRIVMSLFIALIFTALLIDQAIFRKFGYHLNIKVFQDVISNHNRYKDKFVNIYFVFVPWFLFIELIAGSIVWRRIFRLEIRKHHVFVLFLFVFLFFVWSRLSYFYAIHTDNRAILGLYKNFPLMTKWFNWLPKEFIHY